MKTIRMGLVACAIGCTLAVQFPAADGPTETVLHSFGSGTDGKFPEAGLIGCLAA